MKEGMRLSEATVITKNADSYMRKLGQHWSHRFAVRFNENNNCVIELPNGTCELNVGSEQLNIRLVLRPEGDQQRFEQVVEEHLRRFAFKEDLVFAWVHTKTPEADSPA
jgi:hypothetical protein